MSTSKRFSGLMGSPTEAESGKASTPEPSSDVRPASSPVPMSAPQKTVARVQLNTQQPEELKTAVTKAANYLSYTTGGKVTSTDLVERALREFLLSGIFPEEITEGIRSSS